MTKQSAGSACNVRFAGFRLLLIAAVCAVAFAGLSPQQSRAQQLIYNDFNAPQAAPGQSSTACNSISGGAAASGVRFCLNNSGGGLTYSQDFYSASIDPNASTDGGTGSTNYTLQLTGPTASEASSAWYSIPQNVKGGFTAWYAFKITNPSSPTGDGLAFVIQNATGNGTDPLGNCAESGSGLTALGTVGGCMGYGGIDNSIALEADTFPDSYDPWDFGSYDYDDNHIALQACGAGLANSPAHYTSNTVSPLVPTSCLVNLGGQYAMASNPSSSAGAGEVYVADGNPHQVVIVYNGPNDSPANYIYVYLDPTFNPGTHTPVAGSLPIFSGPFDITQFINLNNGTATIGFTAATGGSYEQHELMGFTFTPHGFGSANVCPTGQTTPAPCSATIPVSFTMAATTTIGSVQVVTQGAPNLDFQQGSGSTCSGTISAGSTCTVNVTFAPIAPGLRQGAVKLFGSGGALIQTSLIYGIGQGPAAAFAPGTQAVVYNGNPPFRAGGAAVDAAGDLFIAENQGTGLNNGQIVEVAANGTQTTVGSGLAYPQGLAVDGAGDLFIADNNLNEVVEVTPAGVQTEANFGLTAQLGVAVDGAGDLFVSDFGAGEVVEAPPGCTSSACATVVYSAGSGFHPVGLAVDGAGDLFITDYADTPSGKVVEIPAGCTNSSCYATVGTGWDEPEAVAVDAAGDVFVADENSTVVEIPAGCSSSACQVTVSGTLAYGVAVDGKGDVFIPNLNSGQVLEVNRSQPPSLSYALTNVGAASSPQSVALQNIGNQTLNANGQGLYINDPYANPTPDFSQVPGSGTPADCTTAFSLMPGAACNLSLDFDPQSSGSIQAVVQFFDNALNNSLSSQSIPLSGTGVAVAPPNYTLTVTEMGSGPGAVTSGDGLISCSYANGIFTGNCSQSYASGTGVTLTATPNGTATFLGWGGACSGTNATCTVSMSSAMNVTASFSQAFGGVNVCASGQTTPSPCNSTLAVTFNIPTSTTIGVVQVVTQGITGLDFAQASGGTCVGGIGAGNSCYVYVSFTPLAAGLRMGAVNLFDNTGNLLGTAPIFGIGHAPVAAFGPGTQAAVANGLSAPREIALDAAGDLFIAQNLNNQVVEIPAGGGTAKSLGTGLSGPYGVAVDGAGDVYVADTGNNRVVELPAGGGPQTTVASGLNSPLGVTADGAGDIFIADTDNNQVLELPAGGGPQKTVASGLNNPNTVVVDSTGDLFIVDSNSQMVEIPAGCASSACWTTVGTGLSNPRGAAVDAAGDVFIADTYASLVIEIPAGCTVAACETTVGSGFGYPWGLAVDGAGDVFVTDTNDGELSEINRSQPPSLNFALTAVSNTSADSPHLISLQNVGNQPLTGTLALTLGANFAANPSSTCGSGFSLNPGASCSESFSFTPQSTGLLSGAAYFSDNTMNLSQQVVLQTINLNGSSSASGAAAGVVPNVVGMTQSAAAAALTTTGLALGAVTTQYSDSQTAGSVIGQNPAAGAQANVGTTVALVTSLGVAPTPAPNPLSLLNNYFVTGDYAAAGVTLRGTGRSGMATGTINIPDSTTNPGVSQGVPDGADIIDGYLYWETLENTASPSGNTGTFLGFPITGQQIGSDTPFTDGALTGTLRVYRADVNTYFPVYANGSGVRYGSGAFTVSLPDSGGSGFPVTEGASLVVIYRVLSPNFPLKSVVIYDGSAIPTSSTSQSVQGFYDALGGAAESTILSYAGGTWNSSSGSVSLAAHASQYSAPLNAGSAYGAVIFSTPVTNSDNDGILDAWKSGPAAGDFFAGRPGYYDVKTQSWVPLPGAQHGKKDLFVQLDYMCGAVLASGACDPSQENLFPSPDAQGSDPLAIVKNSFAAIGVALHLEIGNAVPESTCTDNPSATPPQLCEFPGQPGVVDWKNSLEISKVWPRNFASCAAGGDCTARFPYGQKDSYHYVLFGHSLAIPAWNTPYQTLTSITVAGGVTTILTTNRGAPGSINYCPSRFTISGVQGNPSLNGIYNTSSCPDGNTIILSTPGVPNWTYPNSTLPEPEIGLTSGTVTSISGYSDLGGQDSAVTLGLWETAPNQNMATRANVIAGTLYHEVGHTLGLTHGGRYYDTPGSYIPTYEANCKPNFQSTMNYLFQLDGVGPAASVAFSNQTLATLLPGALGSVTQLTDGLGNPATFPTSSWYTSVQPSSGESASTMHCDGTPLTGDTGYRINGSIAPITPPWTTGQNVTFDSITNNDGVSEIEGMPYTQLRGYSDVANIDLRQVGATGGEFASLAGVLSFASPATPINIAPGGNVTLGAGGTVALGSGGTATLSSGENATLSSGGTIALGSGGSVTLNNGGTVTLPASGGTIALGSGGTVTLGSGGVVTLSSAGTIALGSGGTVTLGSGGTVTLGSGGTIALGSGGSVTIPSTGGSYTLPSGGGMITLGSGGTVALGSGGTVALGSGGTIALGSGGTVALGSGGTVALGSGGTVALGSGGVIALGSGGNITMGSGGTVALGSGGTIALGSGGTVALGSGGIVALGSGGNVTIGSGGTATLGSGGTVALGSGGTVALGSGGTVTLSSGGTIALGSGGTVALGSGGTITLSSGGTIALGSGGIYTLSGGGTIALGSGGTVALGSGGTVALGSGGVVALGSGGVIALGSGGTVALGSGGTIALGSGGTVALGSGGATTSELDYVTANSVVRPPVSPTETPMPAPAGQQVVVNWTAPIFGVVQTYSIYRNSDGATPILIGSVSGMNGNPPATTFTDTNPDLTSTTVVYTIVTTLVPDTNGSQRSSPPSPPAVLKNNQTVVIPQPWPSSALISSSPVTLYATAESNNMANMLQVSFSASGNCSIGNQSIDVNGVSSASVTLTSTGSCTITASQTGSTSYLAANSVSGTFSILPANSNVQSQTITFPKLQNVQYGGTFSFSATASSGLPVTFSASGPCTISGATTGAGLCAITASAPANSSYSAATATQSFSISPAVITVKAASPTVTYGAQIPTLTYSLSGFVNNDPTSVVSGVAALTTSATATSNAGSYPITVATGTLSAANYDFLYVPGTLTVQAASQTITFNINAPSTAAYNSMFTVAATATGGTVAFTSSGSCSNSGANYTMTSGTGTCSVIANQTGNGNYSAAPQVIQTVNATPASQTITFTQPTSPVTYGVSPIALSATASSGLTVAFTIDASSTATGTVNGNTLTVSAAGTLVIDANQAGATNYQAATRVQRTIVVNPAAATISISNIPSSAVYEGSFTPTYLYSGNGSPTESVTSSTTGVCKVLAGVVSFVGVGPCILTASATATTDYSAVTGSSQSFTVGQASQTITFTQPTSPVTYGVSPIALSATASSGLTVAFTIDASSTATGTINGNTLTVGAAGTLVIDANQAGVPNYLAAAQVQRTIVVNPAAATISINDIPSAPVYGSNFTPTYLYSGNGSPTKSVTSTTTSVCKVSSGVVSFVGVGPCTLTANATSTTDYSAVTGSSQNFTVGQASQTITFTQPTSPVTYGVSPIALSATASSSLTVIFTIDASSTASGTINGSTLTVKGAGTLVIDANQAGNTDYKAAPLVQRSIAVSKAALTVTANNLSRAFGLANPTLTVSYGGFVNSDTPATALTGSPSLTTTAVAASLPGSYPITVIQGTLAAANYTLTFVNGTLTVTITGSVPASGTACNGAYTGTFQGNLTIVNGQSCVLVGGGASGNITETGGNVVLSSATVGGNVTVNGGSSTFSIGPSTTIKGNLQIQSIPSGSATNQVCGSTISGSLQFQSNGTSVLIGSGSGSCAGNVIKGSLQVLNNTAPITLEGNTISGSLQVQTNSAAVTIDGNKVSGALQVQSNSGATTLDANTVAGGVQDQSNIGVTQVISNIITGTLQCQSNTSITGSGNTATSKQGQCAKF